MTRPHRTTLLRSAWVAGVLAAAVPTEASAQQAQLWRCGNVYSQQPCADGKTVDVRDARTTQQREQTKAAQQRLQSALDARDREAAHSAAEARKAEIARQRAERRQRAEQARRQRKLEAERRKTAREAAARKRRKQPADAASGIGRAVSPQPVLQAGQP